MKKVLILILVVLVLVGGMPILSYGEDHNPPRSGNFFEDLGYVICKVVTLGQYPEAKKDAK